VIWSGGITYNTSTPNSGTYPSLRLNSISTTTITAGVTSIFYVVSYAGGSIYGVYPGLLGNGGSNYIYGAVSAKFVGSQLTNNTIYINGTATTTVPNIQALAIIEVISASTTNLLNAQIGKGDAQDIWNGYVSEIIMFNIVLTTEQRQIIEGYLAQKWGLASSLPANHPYKQ